MTETLVEDTRVITNNIMALLKTKNGGNISDMQKAIGLTYKATYNLAHGKTDGIRLETLDRLCRYFGVGPGEIFQYTPGKKQE